jgi:hypothetical protein
MCPHSGGNSSLTVLVINFMYGADIRMIQCRSRLGLALKAGECLWVFGYVIGLELESHEATEFDILSLVDDTHAAASELLDDAVARDGLADHGRAQDSGRNVRDGEAESTRRVGDNSFVGESSLLTPCYPSRLTQWCSARKGEVR